MQTGDISEESYANILYCFSYKLLVLYFISLINRPLGSTHKICGMPTRLKNVALDSDQQLDENSEKTSTQL